MKKLLLYTFSLVLLILISASLFTRLSGVGIRVPDGGYLGYSAKTDEWLFLQYQNVPVLHDGPYVFNQNGNRLAKYVTGEKTTPAKLTQIDVNDQVTVTVDNESNTTFVVKLKSSHQRSTLNIASPDRLLAISDMEGDFDAMVNLLSANGVINDSLEWVYGAGHLVLIGDMVDRGTNVVPLLWLIYKLEAEAKFAGGNIHYILGNHERYLLDGRANSAAKKYYGTFRTTGMSPRDLWSKDSELGLWLRSKPVMLKIGDTLFVHGGVSPRALGKKLSLEAIDAEAKSSFVLGDTVRRNVNDSILHDTDGLLFYRNLAKDMTKYGLGKKVGVKHLNKVLSHFQVNKLAIGHTLVNNISHDYDGKVIRVDVPHSDGVSEALLMENSALWVVDNKGNKSPLERMNNDLVK